MGYQIQQARSMAEASMIEELAIQDVPVERLDTSNAGSNAPMLGINIAMGFKPIVASNIWQGHLTKAHELLSG